MMYQQISSRLNVAQKFPIAQSALCVAVFSAAMGCATHTLAQGSEVRSLEEVIVTATRRESSIQSVATSIQAVTGADLDNRGIHSFTDMAEVVSGLDLQQPAGSTSSGIYIRGVGTAGLSASDPSVGVVVDGVYQLRPGAVFTELMDIERVEVLRGPQGTLFGKNTTAGAIRIETVKPKTDEFSGRVQTVVGNLDKVELRGLVNIPLIEDVLAVRLNGFTARADGHTDNDYIGKDTRNTDREGGRIKMLWNATDNLEFVLSADLINQDARMDQSLMQYSDSKVAQYGSQLPPISLGNYQQQPSYINEQFKRYSLVANWDVGNHTITSITAYEDLFNDLHTDLEGTIVNDSSIQGVSYLVSTVKTKSLSQELQLASSWDGPFNYIVGAFWQNEKLSSINDMYMGGSDTVGRQSATSRDTDSQAIFGNITYDFNDQWSTSLGVRYTEDDKEGSNGIFSGVKTFDETTYSAKVHYQIDDEKMLYFAYDTGFKSGGINRELSATCSTGGRCLTADEATWDPETTTNYEIGLKSQWMDNRVRFNATAFYQEYEDFQVSRAIIESASQLMSNAAEVISKGIEFDVTFAATNNLTLAGNLSYVKTEYDSYADAPCATSNSCTQDLSGETLDNAPELSYSLSGEYRDLLPGNSGLEWFSRLEVMYKDDVNLFVLQPEETKEDSYYLANAQVGLESLDSWKVSAWVRNLGNEEYVSWASMSADTGVHKVPGLPRTYGVSFDLFF